MTASITGTTTSAAPTGCFVRADRVRLTSHPTLNETWLRERIVGDPSILGLGDLRLADEGRLRDGRLELLLRDPATARRFTVVARVGPAEEADLVRALEQWSVERTRYPEHEHFAVLVAEEFPARVLGAATTLGGSIPLSALQASALHVGDHLSLYFAVVVDQLPRDTRLAALDRAESIGANGNGLHRADETTLPPVDPRATVSPEPAEPDLVEPEPAPAATPFSIRPVDETISLPPEPQARTSIASTRVWDDPADAKPPAMNERPAPAPAPRSCRQPPSVGWRLFSLLATLSLLLCATAAVGWVRSYYVRDVTTFEAGHGQDHVLYSDRGHIEWIAPASDVVAGEPRSTKIPYWLPVGITALLPLAWLIRRRTRVASDPY
jgi:hypothetical protein